LTAPNNVEAELFVINADGTGLRPLTYTVPWGSATVGELRNATGHRVSSFEAPGGPAGVAIAGAKVAVGTQDRGGKGFLTVFAATTGKRLRSVSLAGPAPVVVGANARWVVFRAGARTIRAFDLRTSTSSILAGRGPSRSASRSQAGASHGRRTSVPRRKSVPCYYLTEIFLQRRR
jgi:hypothetical protein